MASSQGRQRSVSRFALISVGILALVAAFAVWFFLDRAGKLPTAVVGVSGGSPGDWNTLVYDKVLDDRLRVGSLNSSWVRQGTFEEERPSLSQEWSTCQVAVLDALKRTGPAAPIAAREVDRDGKPLKCPNLLVIQSPVRTVSMTVHVRRGADLLNWFTKNPDTRKFLETPLGTGLFEGVLELLRVRSEDLKLNGLSGPVFESLLANLLDSDFRIHWSPVKGQRSTTISFKKSGPSSAVLSAVVKATEKAGYVIEGLDGRISEILFGGRTLFFHEDETTFRVAVSLFGMIDSLVTPRDPSPETVPGTIALEIRAESLLGNLLETLVGPGSATWPIWVGFELSAERSEPSTAWVSPSRFGTMVTQKVPLSVLRSIPHDVFAATWFGIRMPQRLPESSWADLAAGNVDFAQSGVEQGLAIVWDLEADASPGVSSMGVVVSTGDKDIAKDLGAIWFEPSLVATCDSGLALAATTSSLLTRMTEACNRRSMSFVDWKQSPMKGLTELPKVGVFVNPVVGAWQTWLAGEVKKAEKSTQPPSSVAKPWVEKMDQARTKLRLEVQSDVKTLPVMSWTISDSGARTENQDGSMQLKGFATKWEHAL
jgi:hypothetical protein